MSSYNPGQGWRPAEQQDDIRDCIAYWDAETRTWSRWVREAPVPPLPTAPYTVIRVTWDELHSEWMPILVLAQEHDWAWSARGLAIDVNDLPKWITSFEVLSEPRAITAKALADHLRGIGMSDVADEVERHG